MFMKECNGFESILMKTYNGLGYNIWILSNAYDAMRFEAILMTIKWIWKYAFDATQLIWRYAYEATQLIWSNSYEKRNGFGCSYEATQWI